LFVEPIYLQPKTDLPYPKLARVLVSFGKQVGFAPTLDEALDQVFGAGTGAAATKPDQGGSTSTTSPPTSTTNQPPASGGSSELDNAVKAIEAALGHLRTAQQSGNFADWGKAAEELDAATKAYDAAKAKQGSQTSTPSSPSTTPSPTPGSGGG